MFDWVNFLERREFEYVDRGPSTSKDNIYIQCPFCGDADHGKHMGISTKGKGWGCWRDERHRGIAPARLVQALLKCGWVEALRIADQKQRSPVGENFLVTVRQAMGLVDGESERSPPLMPKTFAPLLTGTAVPHYTYLSKVRGFSDVEIQWLADNYDLRYCMSEPAEWAYRVIIPVYDERDRLITWTGRAINENAKRRYQTLTTDPEKAQKGLLARAAINDGFLDLSGLLRGGKFLVLMEGPFDAMAVALFADEFKAHADCLFTKSISPAQLDLLAWVRPRYQKVFLVLDPEERASAFRLGVQHSALALDLFLLQGSADPADMRPKEVRDMLKEMATRCANME